MAQLSLVVASVLLAGSVVLFLGGLMPLVMVGVMFDQSTLPVVVPWSIAVTFDVIWIGGIVCCIARFRNLRKEIASTFDRPLTTGDRVVALGHVALLAAFVIEGLSRLGLLSWDLAYICLMASALFYACGLGALALTGRSTRTPTGGPSAEPVGPVNSSR